MAEISNLPRLPASDELSLKRNTFHGFYEIGSRDFWGKNQISYDNPKSFETCEHVFEEIEEGIKCKDCNMGLTGELDIRDGRLYIDGEPVFFVKETK